MSGQGTRAAEKVTTDAARAVALEGKIPEGKIFEGKIFEGETMRPVPLHAGAAVTVCYGSGRGSPLT